MRRIAILLVIACTGCDLAFGLKGHSDTGADAAPDADVRCWAPEQPGDEDGDRFSDGCDPCPADVDAKIMDADGDTVGDECDPVPDVPDVRIVSFDGFADDGAWATMSGGWTGSNGDFSQTLSIDGAAERAITPASLPVVDVRFTAANPPCIGVN